MSIMCTPAQTLAKVESRNKVYFGYAETKCIYGRQDKDMKTNDISNLYETIFYKFLNNCRKVNFPLCVTA